MNMSVNKKIVSVCLILVMLFSLSGCSEFLQEIAIEKINGDLAVAFLSSPAI